MHYKESVFVAFEIFTLVSDAEIRVSLNTTSKLHNMILTPRLRRLKEFSVYVIVVGKGFHDCFTLPWDVSVSIKRFSLRSPICTSFYHWNSFSSDYDQQTVLQRTFPAVLTIYRIGPCSRLKQTAEQCHSWYTRQSVASASSCHALSLFTCNGCGLWPMLSRNRTSFRYSTARLSA